MPDQRGEFRHDPSRTIRAHAMSLPETDEGTSCVNRAFKAGGKNFAFLGETDDTCRLRLKLDASIPEIDALAAHRDGRFEVGKGGWTMLEFAADDPLPNDDLERWVTESFRLLAPKKVTALLDE